MVGTRTFCPDSYFAPSRFASEHKVLSTGGLQDFKSFGVDMISKKENTLTKTLFTIGYSY